MTGVVVAIFDGFVRWRKELMKLDDFLGFPKILRRRLYRDLVHPRLSGKQLLK